MKTPMEAINPTVRAGTRGVESTSGHSPLPSATA